MKLQPEEEEGEEQLGRLPGGGVFQRPFPDRASSGTAKGGHEEAVLKHEEGSLTVRSFQEWDGLT